MTDVVDTFIDAIHVELCRFSRCGNAKLADGKITQISTSADTDKSISYCIGAPSEGQHQPQLFVAWIENGGRQEPVEAAATDTCLCQDVVKLKVAVTAATKETCRLLWMNVRNAVRRICGSQMTWADFTEPMEQSASQITPKSFALLAEGELRIPIRKNPQQLPGFPVPIADYTWRKAIAVADHTTEEL